jgi:hypothetical protein
MTKRFDPDDFPDFPPEWRALLPTPDELFKVLKTSMGPQHAVLDESGDVQVASLMQWAQWMEKNHAQRVIARDDIAHQRGLRPEIYTVSTVFLGLNHQYLPNRRPLWFESMVFGPVKRKYYKIFKETREFRDDLWMERCTTRVEALAMHERGVEWLKNYLHEKSAKSEKEN